MTRAEKALVTGLAVQTAIAGAAVFLEWTGSCGNCRSGAVSPAAVGFIGYGALLAAAFRHGPSSAVFSGVLVALGVHAGLVLDLLQAGIRCSSLRAARDLARSRSTTTMTCSRPSH